MVCGREKEILPSEVTPQLKRETEKVSTDELDGEKFTESDSCGGLSAYCRCAEEAIPPLLKN